MTETRTSLIDAAPLIDALTRIRDAGRARRDSGINDAAVEYARLAHDVLQWFEADGAGNIEEAKQHLTAAQSRLGTPHPSQGVQSELPGM